MSSPLRSPADWRFSTFPSAGQDHLPELELVTAGGFFDVLAAVLRFPAGTVSGFATGCAGFSIFLVVLEAIGVAGLAAGGALTGLAV